MFPDSTDTVPHIAAIMAIKMRVSFGKTEWRTTAVAGSVDEDTFCVEFSWSFLQESETSCPVSLSSSRELLEAMFPPTALVIGPGGCYIVLFGKY